MPPISQKDLSRAEAGHVKFPTAVPGRSKETISSPETEKVLDKIVSGGPEVPPASQETAQPGPPSVQPGFVAMSTAEKERLAQIEKILSEGLMEIYAQLEPDRQKAFKQSGEETAAKINLLLGKAKIKLGEIISLIKKWLMIIPGVNRFFVEQEAKIKADEIIRLSGI